MTASGARPRHSLDLNANALTVLERRYLVKDDHGKPVELPEDLFWRGLASDAVMRISGPIEWNSTT